MEPKNSQSVQKMRVTEEDKSLMRSTFKDRDDLLLATRNLFFGFELDDHEKELIKGTYQSSTLRKLMRKLFLPELQKDIPLGQEIDLWMTVQLTDSDSIYRLVRGRAKLIKMIETALSLLENPDGEKPDLLIPEDAVMSDIETRLTARNTFITHMELQLNVIKQLASTEELTPEEALTKLRKDSAK